MKRINIIIAIILLQSIYTYGQFSLPMQQWANDVENRILVVTLKEKNPRKIKKLKRKDNQELEQYMASISEHNTKLHELVDKYWPYTNKIVYKNKSDVREIIKNKDSRYVILHYKPSTENRASVKVIYHSDVYTLMLYLPEYGRKVINNLSVDDQTHGSILHFNRGEYIFKISLPYTFLNERDIEFAFYQFKDCIDKAKTNGYTKKYQRYRYNISEFNNENAYILKNKTLLIPKEICTVPEDQIANFYHAPFSIVSLGEVEDLLKNDSEKKYAYYNIIWSDKYHHWTFFIINNTNGQILAENPTIDKGVQIHLAFPFGNSLEKLLNTDAQFVINLEHLNNLTEYIEDGK